MCTCFLSVFPQNVSKSLGQRLCPPCYCYFLTWRTISGTCKSSVFVSGLMGRAALSASPQYCQKVSLPLSAPLIHSSQKCTTSLPQIPNTNLRGQVKPNKDDNGSLSPEKVVEKKIKFVEIQENSVVCRDRHAPTKAKVFTLRK